MDVLLIIQTLEIVGILAYVIKSRTHHEDLLTQCGLLCVAVLLACDVFIFRRHRPDWFRDTINHLSFVVCYEKIFRKYWLVFWTMLGR